MKRVRKTPIPRSAAPAVRPFNNASPHRQHALRPRMKLSQVLFSQGFGARRECEGLIASGHVTLRGQVCDDPFQEVDTDGLVYGVRGELWPYHAKALIAMNKP